MASQTLQTIRNGWAPEIKRLNDNLKKTRSISNYLTCVISKCVFVTTTTPVPVSGIQQHTLIV